MCRFEKTLIETMRLSAEGIDNIIYHVRRMNNSRRELFNSADSLDIASIQVPDVSGTDILKFRILYGEKIESIEFIPYIPRKIKSLRLVNGDSVEYCFKYEDRKHLESLREKRHGCDEVLIVRDGRVTDTTFTNVAFHDGGKWFTPAFPLLAGTRRASLVDKGVLRVADIMVKDIWHFRTVRLFNSMIRFDKAPLLPISAIYSGR